VSYWRPSTAARILSVMLVVGLAGAGIRATFAAFSSSTSNPTANLAAAPDWTPPLASATAVQKSTGGEPGYVKPGAGYHVFAQVADEGNPPAGVAAVTVTSGITAVLSAGSYTAFGVSYNYRTAIQSLAGASPGTYLYSVNSTDLATPPNTGTQSNIGSFVVDGTAPSASAFSATNGGSTAGNPQQADVVTFTFSEPIDPQSILSGWLGAAQNVVVRVTDNVNNDTLTVWNAANTAQLPLGSVQLKGNYVSATRTYGATGTASTMTRGGNAITVNLGTASAGANTVTGANAPIWTPSATATDRAANAMPTTNLTAASAVQF
jgi:hypothetical protein